MKENHKESVPPKTNEIKLVISKDKKIVKIKKEDKSLLLKSNKHRKY